jgi:hypothetical protein
MMSKGGPSGAGIPRRTTIFMTISPSGLKDSTDYNAITTAISNCPVGQVVLLASGQFWIGPGNGAIVLGKAITLRGAGAGQTIISKVDGAVRKVAFTASASGTILTVSAILTGTPIFPAMDLNDYGNLPGGTQISSQASGTTGGIGTYNLNQAVGTIASETMNGVKQHGATPSPVISIQPPLGTSPTWGGPTSSTQSVNLTQDVISGTNYIFVDNVAPATGVFVPGQIVLLDAVSGAQWMPDTIPQTGVTAVFTGSITGTVLTVSSMISGSILAPSSTNYGPMLYTGTAATLAANLTFIKSQASGTTGGVGTYNLNDSLTVPSQTMCSGYAMWSNPEYTVNWRKHRPSWPNDTFSDTQYPYQDGTEGDFFSRLDRITNEIKEIQSVDVPNKKITFTSPISYPYKVSRQAQLTWLTDLFAGSAYLPHLQGAGVEAMSLQGGDALAQVPSGLTFNYAAYCWAKNVEVYDYLGHGLCFSASFRCEAREFYVHHAVLPEPGGGAYNISLDGASSEILCENGISVLGNKVTTSLASGAGSVFGYCYCDQSYIDYTGTSSGNSVVENGIGASHMAGSHHVLFEGCWSHNADLDAAHGSSGYGSIFFRCALSGFREAFTNLYGAFTVDDQSQPSNSALRCAGASQYTPYVTYVGNVLGLQGKHSGWVYDDPNGNAPSIWLMGWGETAFFTNQSDPLTRNTMIRDGNWDWLQSVQTWHNTPNGPPVLANSMYLTTRPAFFGDNPWPWVDPKTGTTYTLPAKARWDAGMPNG